MQCSLEYKVSGIFVKNVLIYLALSALKNSPCHSNKYSFKPKQTELPYVTQIKNLNHSFETEKVKAADLKVWP